MPIDQKKSTPLYIQIVDDLCRLIALGKLRPGEKVRSQSDLAEFYGVSLITVKKALWEMSKDGILYSRVGKGTYVAEQSPLTDGKEFKSIGFVLTDLKSPFFSRILESVEKKAGVMGFSLLLSSSENKIEKEESLIQDFRDIGVRGLIIASMDHIYTANPIIHQLEKENFPYVVVSFITDPDICFVGTDHEEGGFIATEHLISCGYKNIGYINGEKGNLCGEERKKGYLRALQHHNIPYSEKYEYRLPFGGEWNDFRSGYKIGEQFVKYSDRPEAVFAYNDLVALGFQKAMLEGGLKIPEDIAIVGFDNISECTTASVPLTTVDQPTDRIGNIAVDVLYRKCRGEEVETRQVLKPKMVIRDSCGCTKVDL
jgi:DNA-binding LacI/PurR family transcriptional regulator